MGRKGKAILRPFRTDENLIISRGTAENVPRETKLLTKVSSKQLVFLFPH